MTNNLPVTNKRGDLFVAFHLCEESCIPDTLEPITHSLVVATHNDNTLLILNTWKQLWELPGGIKEAHETPRECALRELLEETNQVTSTLIFRGIMEFRLQPDGRTEYGALFRGVIDNPRPFISDGESLKMIFWDGSSEVGEIELIDKALTIY